MKVPVIVIQVIVGTIVYIIGRFLTENFGSEGWSSGSYFTGIMFMAIWQIIYLIAEGM